MKKVILLGLVTLLCACTTLDEEGCLSADWAHLGELDGQRGGLSRLNNHIKACGKHGIVLNNAMYNQGYVQGLEAYCTYENGVSLGVAAVSYKGVCRGEASAEFLSGYTPNFNVTKANKKVNNRKDDVNKIQRKLNADDLDRNKRVTLMRELAEADIELAGKKDEAREYEHELKIHTLDRQILMIHRDLKNEPVSVYERDDMLLKIENLQDRREGEIKSFELERSVRTLNRIKRIF